MDPRARELLAALEPWGRPVAGPWERLRGCLEQHAGTAFGREYGFSSIRSEEDFREAVPAMDYEGYRGWIERVAAGERGVLACAEPDGFERSSGSLAAAKWIPVTDGLRGEFARGLASWFGGWCRRVPEVFEGRGYFSVSPPGMARETAPCGLPVGLDGDAAFFPEDLAGPLGGWLVVPELGGDSAAVFDETAEALLAAGDLSVVSVWSPTFLLGIDEAVRRRAGGRTWRELWPRLAVVSCWADAASAPWIPRVRERLGAVVIEPKGLLATEGVVTLPDAADGSPRLAAECHYHEFLDGDGQVVAVGDLVADEEYEVLLSTGGGLFRYRLGDRVRVMGFGREGLPRMRFVGRVGAVSDLVGEKLSEGQVLEALAGCGARGFLVADAGGPGYEAFLEDPGRAGALECLLRRNPYYDQARGLGQLAGLRVRRLEDGWLVRLGGRLAARRGCRLGDVKPPLLLTGISVEEVAEWLG